MKIEKPKNKDIGLSGKAKTEWPSQLKTEKAIDGLAPGSDAHREVLDYLMKRLSASERSMENFCPRWTAAEIRAQSYIKKSNFEAIIKNFNDKGEPPRPLNITVPYIFSTINSIVTYLMHTFTRRRPMFQIDTHKDEYIKAARVMEGVLQFNAEHERMAKKLRQFFWDGELYGVAVLRTEWKTETSKRTSLRPKPQTILGLDVSFALGESGETEEITEEYMSFQGTSVQNIAPEHFFPDPTVPMSEVSREGEYVFWKQHFGKHMLLKEQSAGRLKWVNYIPSQSASDEQNDDSRRGLLANSPSSGDEVNDIEEKNRVDVHFCSIDIIPRELGLSSSMDVEKWVFAVANRQQILMAEKLDHNHNLHPVLVSEPYTLGYELGQPSIADHLGPLQDLISWYANSHVHNVRTSLNNMFLYNPQMINEQDIANPAPGKGIRILPTAIGTDTEKFFRQLDVRDVTANHLADLQNFTRIADVMSGVNDNIRGVEEPNSSRRTASEVRISAQSAASRLADHAQLISSPAISDLSMMMCVNYQQFLSEEFYVRVVGEKGLRTPLAINRDSIAGDFTFPTHDGTLPTDKVALVEVWKEIFTAIAPDPQLRQQYDLAAILDWMASESGADNLRDFKVQVQAGEPQQGQVPLAELAGQLK